MSGEKFAPDFGSPYQVLVDHCESAGLKFKAEPEVKGVFYSMRGEAAIYDFSLLITHEDEVLQICMTIPVVARDEKIRPLIAEFTVHARSKSAQPWFCARCRLRILIERTSCRNCDKILIRIPDKAKSDIGWVQWICVDGAA